jgi:hypothetical protein
MTYVPVRTIGPTPLPQAAPPQGTVRMVRWVSKSPSLKVKFVCQLAGTPLVVCSFVCSNPDQIPGLKLTLIEVNSPLVPFIAQLGNPIPPAGQCYDAGLFTRRTPNRTWGSDGGLAHTMGLDIDDPVAPWSILEVQMQVQFPYELDPVSMRGTWCYDGLFPAALAV